MAEEAKARAKAKAEGFAALREGQSLVAIRHYTKAIELSDGPDCSLHYQRSTAYIYVDKFSEALEDARISVRLQPHQPINYIPLASAYLGLRKYSEAIDACRTGLEIDPDNPALKVLMEMLVSRTSKNRELAQRNPHGDTFSQWLQLQERLESDPVTRNYLKDRDFVEMMKEVQTDKMSLNRHLKDRRVMDALGVLLHVKFREPKEPEVKEEETESTIEAEPLQEVKPVEMAQEERAAVIQKKELARQEMEKVTEYMRKEEKDMNAALTHCNKAIDLDDDNIWHCHTRAHLYASMKKYEECIKDCNKVIELGRRRDPESNSETVAMALVWKGNALMSLAKCPNDYDAAIKCFGQANVFYASNYLLRRVNEAIRRKRGIEQQLAAS